MSKHYSPFSIHELIPQEEKLEVKKQKGKLVIGLPKETHFEEKRICLTPDAVAALSQHGHKIIVESQAGKCASFTDQNYSDAGAEISYDAKQVFECHVILKIEPPTLDEIKLIKPQSILVSALQLKTQSKKYFESLAQKKLQPLLLTSSKMKKECFQF